MSALDVFGEGRRFAVLAGAGVSLDAPARLIDGRRFVRAVVDAAIPPDIPAEWLLSHLERSKARSTRPGEFVRFEQFMMSLAEELDRELRVLECLTLAPEPNVNHVFLARLARAGHVVLTTNFDDCIERAYRQLAGAAPLRVVVYDEEFPNELPPRIEQPTLWKLHGSLTRAGLATPDSIRATMTSVMATLEERSKYRFLADVCTRCDLLLLGYSGMDDFDVNPVVAETPSNRQLVWVDHCQAPGWKEVPGAALQRSVCCEADVVGRDRVFFRLAFGPEPLRPKGAAVLVRGNTAEIVRHLASRLFPDASAHPSPAPGVPEGNGLASFFQDRHAEWVAHDAARYSAVLSWTQLIENRPHTDEALRLRTRLRQGRSIALQRPNRTPTEHLESLRQRFSADQSSTDLASLEVQLAVLIHSLPEASMPLALRLRGLIVFWQGNAQRAFELLEQSLQIARSQRNAGEVLDTIDALERIAWHVPRYDVLRELEHERARLVERSGYQPWQWAKDLGEPFEVQLETRGPEKLVSFLQRVRRFAVDVGDVFGEAQATYKLAAAWWELDEHEYARMELVRSGLLLDYLRTASDLGISWFLPRVPGMDSDALLAHHLVPQIRALHSESMFTGP